MRRSVRLGLFIGLIIGLSACASARGTEGASVTGAYGSIGVGRTG